MKKHSFSTLLLNVVAVCAAAGLSACQELKIDSQAEFPPKMEIDAQESYTLLAQSPNVITFNVSSNTPWRIESSAQWCTPDPAMSSASSLVAEITVTTEDNDSDQARTATLTVTGEEIQTPTVITITQEARDAFILQAPEEGNIPTAGGEKVFKVISNKEWKVTTDAIWLEFSALSGDATSQEGTPVTVSVKDNPGMERSAVITVTSGLSQDTFEVTQDGIVLEFTQVEDQSELVYNCLGGTKEFKVTSNIAWKPAASGYDNVTVEKVDDETVSVTVSGANKYFTSQRYDISIVPEDASLTGLEPAVLSVSQQAIAWLSNAVANEDGSVTLTPDNSESRVCTNAGLSTGTLKWTFRDVNLASGLFDINAWQSPGPTYHAWIGGTNSMNTGGVLANSEQSFWASGTMDVTLEELNAMETLELTIFPTADASRLVFTLYLNGEQISTLTTPCNPWGEMGESPVPYYFGFAGDSGATGTMTITSFEYTPYSE